MVKYSYQSQAIERMGNVPRSMFAEHSPHQAVDRTDNRVIRHSGH